MNTTTNNQLELSEEDELALIELLEISAQDYKKGNFTSHEDLRKLIKTWPGKKK